MFIPDSDDPVSVRHGDGHIESFPPITSSTARVLILGTMPGGVLRERQYYAHPQNAFWRIIGAILGFDPALPYVSASLRCSWQGIAIWDVLKACARAGSLDRR